MALNKAAQDFRRRGIIADADALNSLRNKVQTAMRQSVLTRVFPDLEALLRAELIAVQAGPRPAEDQELLSILRKALLAMRALAFTYHGGKRPGATRKVTPYGIIFGRMNYLVGPELGTTRIKDWRLDRIADVHILPDVASPPADSASLTTPTRPSPSITPSPRTSSSTSRSTASMTTWRAGASIPTRSSNRNATEA